MLFHHGELYFDIFVYALSVEGWNIQYISICFNFSKFGILFIQRLMGQQEHILPWNSPSFFNLRVIQDHWRCAPTMKRRLEVIPMVRTQMVKRLEDGFIRFALFFSSYWFYHVFFIGSWCFSFYQVELCFLS